MPRGTLSQFYGPQNGTIPSGKQVGPWTNPLPTQRRTQPPQARECGIASREQSRAFLPAQAPRLFLRLQWAARQRAHGPSRAPRALILASRRQAAWAMMPSSHSARSLSRSIPRRCAILDGRRRRPRRPPLPRRLIGPKTLQASLVRLRPQCRRCVRPPRAQLRRSSSRTSAATPWRSRTSILSAAADGALGDQRTRPRWACLDLILMVRCLAGARLQQRPRPRLLRLREEEWL